MDLNIEKEKFDAIARAIHSETSPVGIDAKKTHVIILEKLLQIEKRLTSIEEKLAKKWRLGKRKFLDWFDVIFRR